MTTILESTTSPSAPYPPGAEAEAGTTARRLAANALVPLATQVVTRVLMLGYAMVQYRLLGGGRHALDEYFLAATIFMYASTVADWGLNTLLTREAARAVGDAKGMASLFNRTLTLRAALGVVLFLPVGLYLAVYGTLFHLSAQGVWATLLLTACLLPSALSGSVTALLYAHERMALPSAIGLLTSALNVVLGVGALLVGWGIAGLAGAALAATLVTAALFLYVLRRDFPHLVASTRLTGLRRLKAVPAMQALANALRRQEMLPLLSAGWPLMLNSLLVGLFFRADQFIIRPAAGGLALEQYNAAYSFLNFVLLISPAVTLALFPRMARHAVSDRARLAAEYTFALRVLLVIAVPVVLLTVWFAPLLITVLTGGSDRFLPQAAIALQILIFFLPFSFINGLTQYVLIAFDLQRLITRAFALTVVFNVGANLLLVPVLGIYGAALTTILSELVLMVPFLRWARREVGRVPVVALAARPALAGVAAGVAMWLAWPITARWSEGRSELAVYVGAALLPLVLYAAVLYATRPFSEAEVRTLRAALPPLSSLHPSRLLPSLLHRRNR